MLVSVIIPVYNTRRTALELQLESILGQSEQDFEVIIIDDGSAHEYACYLDGLQHRDARIRILHFPNGGNHLARYRGIAEACGEWIYICDADDFLYPKLLEYCLWLAKREQADFVSFRFNRCRGNDIRAVEDIGRFEDIKVEVAHPIVDAESRASYLQAMSLVHIDNWAQFMRASLAKSLPPVSGTSDLTRSLRLMLGSRVWAASHARLYYYNAGEENGITMSPLKLERVIDSFADWRRFVTLFLKDGQIDHADPVWQTACRGFLLINLKIVYNWIRRRKLLHERKIYLKEFTKALNYIFHELHVPMTWCKLKQRWAYRLLMLIYGGRADA